MSTSLRYQLTAKAHYVYGAPVVLDFTLENISSRDVWILSWYTPLEGIKGKILDVLCDGVEIPYEGRMMKRGNPSRDDYIHLPGGGSTHAQFDLSEAYSLPECREYRVSFNGQIHDLVLEEQQVPRMSGGEYPVDIPGNPVSFSISR